jgi:hypothetical protein
LRFLLRAETPDDVIGAKQPHASRKASLVTPAIQRTALSVFVSSFATQPMLEILRLFPLQIKLIAVVSV